MKGGEKNMIDQYNQQKAAEIRLARAANPEAQARIRADQVIQILKPFSRETYNKDNMMEQRFQRSIIEGQPIQLVSFWGVSEKKSPDTSDFLMLDEYRIIKELIEAITSSKVGINIILANTHGRFNGYQDFEGYYGSIYLEARRKGLIPISLDRLYEEWGIDLPDINQPVDEKLWKKFTELRQSVQLIESAKKHSRLGIEPDKAAYLYWLMRHQEAESLSRTFSNGVLFINGSRDLGMVTLPRDMPHVYSRFGPVWFQ